MKNADFRALKAGDQIYMSSRPDERWTVICPPYGTVLAFLGAVCQATRILARGTSWRKTGGISLPPEEFSRVMPGEVVYDPDIPFEKWRVVWSDFDTILAVRSTSRTTPIVQKFLNSRFLVKLEPGTKPPKVADPDDRRRTR